MAVSITRQNLVRSVSLGINEVDENGGADLVNGCFVEEEAVGVIGGFLRAVDGSLAVIDTDSVPAGFNGAFGIPPWDVAVSDAIPDIVATKVVNTDLANFRVAVKVTFETLGILSPVGIRIGNVVVAVFWSADRFIEVGEFVGIGDDYFRKEENDEYRCCDGNAVALAAERGTLDGAGDGNADEEVDEGDDWHKVAIADGEVAGHGDIRVESDECQEREFCDVSGDEYAYPRGKVVTSGAVYAEGICNGENNGDDEECQVWECFFDEKDGGKVDRCCGAADSAKEVVAIATIYAIKDLSEPLEVHGEWACERVRVEGECCVVKEGIARIGGGKFYRCDRCENVLWHR